MQRRAALQLQALGRLCSAARYVAGLSLPPRDDKCRHVAGRDTCVTHYTERRYISEQTTVYYRDVT